MANYSILKAAVEAVVKTNGNQEITGANLQTTILSIIDSLCAGYQFMGVATPLTTPPSSPDYNIAYIGGAGAYANFGTSYTVPQGSIGVFRYNGSWSNNVIHLSDGLAFNGIYVLRNKVINYANNSVTITNNSSYDIIMVHIPVNVVEGTLKLKITGIANVNRLHFFSSSALDEFVAGNWVFKYDWPNGVEITVPTNAQLCAFGVLHTDFPNGYTGIDVLFTEDLSALRNSVEDLQTKDLQTLKLYLATIDSSGVFNPVKQGSTSYTRAAIRAYYRSPVTIETNSGYVIYYKYKYQLTGNGELSFVESKQVNASSVGIEDDGYIYRFNFKKSDNSSINENELGSIIKSFNSNVSVNTNAINDIANGEIVNIQNVDIPATTTISPTLIPNIYLRKGYTYNFKVTLASASPVLLYFWVRHVDNSEHDARLVVAANSDSGEVAFTAPVDGIYWVNYRFFDTSSDLVAEEITIYTPMNVRKIYEQSQKNMNPPFGFFFGNPYYAHFLVADRTTVSTSKIIAPSQSLFDIEVSARLGFKYIELNAHKTSDGKFVCFHGTGEKFDGQFELSDNPTGLFATQALDTIAVRDVPLSDIMASVRNRAKYAKYRTAPNTLEDCLMSCRKNGIKPFVTFTAETAPIIESIMGKDDYIGYIGGRAQITNTIRQMTNAMLFVYDEASHSLDDAYSYAELLGSPVLYDCTYADWLEESVTKEYVEEMHKRGVYVCGVSNYRNEAWNQKAIRCGYDAICSGWDINPIEHGNICNLQSDIDFSDFTHNGEVTNYELHLSDGNTVVPNFQIPSVFVGGGYLEVKFIGTLSVVMGDKINLSVSSDNNDVHLFSTAFFEAAPTFTITSVGSATISGITYKASRL